MLQGVIKMGGGGARRPTLSPDWRFVAVYRTLKRTARKYLFDIIDLYELTSHKGRLCGRSSCLTIPHTLMQLANKRPR